MARFYRILACHLGVLLHCDVRKSRSADYLKHRAVSDPGGMLDQRAGMRNHA
jgi:hypothetical protein